jgi:hypothetical protein
MADERSERNLVAELQRWQDAGAAWQVVSRTRRTVTIALLRCDGGEEVGRFSTEDPRVLNFVGNRRSSEEEPG